MKTRKKLLFYILIIIAFFLSSRAAKTFPERDSGPIVTDGRLEVSFIDVDQGDATLIKTPDGDTILIDGGEYDIYDSRLAPFLAEQGINKVDLAITTHYHSDHMGGIMELVKDGGAECLVLPDYEDTDHTKTKLIAAAESTGTELQYVSAEDIIETDCKGLSIKILHPLKGGSDGSNFHNNSSLVILVSYHGTDFLITGDIESRAENELVRRSYVECDVLKVPHHGSSSSSSQSFLQATDPTYAIISAGTNNSYGHPHYEVLEALDNEDIRVYRTDRDGTITFTVSESGIENISFSKS